MTLPTCLTAFAASAAILPSGASSFVASRSALRANPVLRAVAKTPARIRMEDGIDFEAVAKKMAADLAAQGIKVQKQFDTAGKDSFEAGEDPIVITEGNGGMPMVILRHANSAQEAQIYTYGAAVTSWKTRGVDSLWVSGENKWVMGGKAIRGGIPICFPQFGPYGDLVQHGFARVSDWKIENTFVADDGSVSAVFVLSNDSDSEAVAAWPHKFFLKYTVTLSAAGMETNLQVTNTDDKPFEVTMAFHNYFKTTKVSDTRVFGLEGLNYFNRLAGDKEEGPESDTGAGTMVDSETDRIYLNVPEELAVFDFTTLKIVKIKKTPSLPEATLWNPFGGEGADPGWKDFVCVEPACIAKPATIAPGESWVASQLLGVE